MTADGQVLIELVVATQYIQIFTHRLRYYHPVEWVFVVEWELVNQCGVLELDVQQLYQLKNSSHIIFKVV